jgi:hypothetical protein
MRKMSRYEAVRALREARLSRVPRSAASIRVPVSNSPNRASGKGSNKNKVSNRDPRDGLTKLQRWRKAHARHYREYMRNYMRDWRCRRAVRKATHG